MSDESLVSTPMEQEAVGLGALETATGARVKDHPDFEKALEDVSALQLRRAHEEPKRFVRGVRIGRPGAPWPGACGSDSGRDGWHGGRCWAESSVPLQPRR